MSTEKENIHSLAKTEVPEVLLGEYFKQEIKIHFTTPEEKQEEKTVTLYLIPAKQNRDGDYYESKFTTIRNKLEELGNTNVYFEPIGNEIQMEQSAIDNYVNNPDLTIQFDSWWEQNFANDFAGKFMDKALDGDGGMDMKEIMSLFAIAMKK